MGPIWGFAYRYKFYSTSVLGTAMHSRGTLAGTKGTTMKIEFYKPPVEAREDLRTSIESMKGVAKDSKGNVYKNVSRNF